MKNIKITHDCFVKGEPVTAGTTIKNLDESDAAALLVSGRARLATKDEVGESPKAPEKAPEAKKQPSKKKSSKKAK